MSTGASIRSELKASFAGALVGTLAGALATGAWDAFRLLAIGAGARSVLVPLAAAFVLVTVGTVVVAGLALASRGLIGLLERLGVDWAFVVSAIVVGPFTVLGAQAAVLVVLSGAGIRTAVIALSAALGVALSVALALALRALAARAKLRASLSVRAVLFALGSIATLVATVYLAPGLMEELDSEGLGALGIPIVTGLTVALLGIERRTVVRFAAGAWLVLGVCAISHAALHAPPSLRRHTARETDASRVVLSFIRTYTQRELPPLQHGSGTCRPGVAPGVIRGKPAVASEGAPNIVVITSDSVRWDHTSLSGYKRDTTPHLKRWAKSAAVFSSAYTPASSTRQTFRALFTGLFPSLVPPSSSKVWWGVSLPPQQISLADRLKHAGYRTVSSTLARGGFDPKVGALKGFEAFLPKVPGAGGGEGAANERMIRGQFDNILKELRSGRGKPVFTWAHLMVTHQPYRVTTKNQYGTEEIDDYDWAIKYVDRELNRMLEALQKEELLARTIVIFSADHGQAFGEHGSKLHGHTVYQEETHVPLLIWGPGVEPGLRPEAVSTLDITPTMLELAGAPAGRELCGASLLPWLRAASQKSTRPVYTEQAYDGRGGFAISYVKGRHRLMVSPRDRVNELFDIKADPSELNDLGGEREDLMNELVQELVKFQRDRGMAPKSYGLR
jgi:arylsulfatase A-like enzyme